MTTVDFYLLATADAREKRVFACRLVDKAYQQGKRVYVNVPDEVFGHEFDDLLWTFRDISFVPHRLAGKGERVAAPVVIGFASGAAEACDILMNLNHEVPPQASAFERILEIVSEEAGEKAQSRQKYREYQSLGCPIQTHDLREVAR